MIKKYQFEVFFLKIKFKKTKNHVYKNIKSPSKKYFLKLCGHTRTRDIAKKATTTYVISRQPR
jgi:hypothetical protein